ncbi:MAG: UDP-3-O-(3-hydroxymyristoyl)glucosamine N-acyltransferase [Gammaproteobacteria bacterium]
MITVADLALKLEASFIGDGEVNLSGIASLNNAQEGDLSFLADKQYKNDILTTAASAVLVRKGEAADCPAVAIICADPYAAYIVAARVFYPEDDKKPGVHSTAIIDQSATVHSTAYLAPGVIVEANAHIAENVQIGPGCVIGKDVSIGKDSVLCANCTLSNARIGERANLQPGVVIGSDGFGNVRTEDGWVAIPQIGGVEIGHDVSIGANTTIDRGAIDPTVIGDGVKIDNQVQIAHNVAIGDHTAIAGCVGIAGSARIGANCLLAGGVGVVGHLEIADGVTVTGMTMVTHSIKASGIYSSGTPIMENGLWRKNAVRLKTLDRLARRVEKLEKSDKTNT